MSKVRRFSLFCLGNWRRCVMEIITIDNRWNNLEQRVNPECCCGQKIDQLRELLGKCCRFIEEESENSTRSRMLTAEIKRTLE